MLGMIGLATAERFASIGEFDFTPGVDSQILYVSSSLGDDTTAKRYLLQPIRCWLSFCVSPLHLCVHACVCARARARVWLCVA